MPDIPKIKGNPRYSSFTSIPKGFAGVIGRDIIANQKVYLRSHIKEGYDFTYTGVCINKNGFAVVKDYRGYESIFALRQLCKYKTHEDKNDKGNQ